MAGFTPLLCFHPPQSCKIEETGKASETWLYDFADIQLSLTGVGVRVKLKVKSPAPTPIFREVQKDVNFKSKKGLNLNKYSFHRHFRQKQARKAPSYASSKLSLTHSQG